MSISVNQIKVSINGTESNGFKIEIDGAKYRLDNFEMTQKLLSPCTLDFMLRKDPEEDISEIQFTACSTIIGKEVKLTLQTDVMEKHAEGGGDSDAKTAALDFEGFITSAYASRYESEYVMQVHAMSKDAAMMNHPTCYIYNETTLDMISLDVVKRSDLGVGGGCKTDQVLFYTAQYNETDYDFLRRLAIRYGEWMFNNGKRFFFGKLDDDEIEDVRLKYPSLDIESYSVSLQTAHQNFREVGLGYNELGYGVAHDGTDQPATGNKLNDSTFEASKKIYPSKTRMLITGASIETDDQIKSSNIDENLYSECTWAEKHGLRANMLVYEGTTFCSRMKIGARLTIIDNFITGTATQKSEVQQDAILVTEVKHTFGVDDKYKNTFRGVTANIDYPPYYDPNIFPRCDHPLRAHVVETDDPQHWGRVKVRFPWQMSEYADKDLNGVTPWLRVTQQYVGADGYKFGQFIIPEKFTEVLVDFEEGNFERPYVIGSLYSKNHPVPDSWNPGENNVKAIRTASGHTIEIHDNEKSGSWGTGGYISIYDDETHNYEVLLSTDKKLIRLKSKGNIELIADRDIKLTAGNDIKMKAGHDMKINVDNDYTLDVERDIWVNAVNDFDIHADNEGYISTTSKMDINTEDELYITSDKDTKQEAKGNYEINVKKNYTALADQEVGIGGKKKVTVKSSNEMEINAQQKLKQYATTYELNALQGASISATATIDIKAAMIKES